jgi:hypothetical protein
VRIASRTRCPGTKRLRDRSDMPLGGRPTRSANETRCVATGLGGSISTGITRDHGTSPTGHLPERVGQGALQAPTGADSLASLPWTAPASSGAVCRAPTREAVFHRGERCSTVESVEDDGDTECSLHASVGAGEEPHWLHRVSPWSPMIPMNRYHRCTAATLDTRRSRVQRDHPRALSARRGAVLLIGFRTGNGAPTYARPQPLPVKRGSPTP